MNRFKGIVIPCLLFLAVFHASVSGQDATDTTVRYLPTPEIRWSDNILEIIITAGKRNARLRWNMEPSGDDVVYELWRKSDTEKSYRPIASGLTQTCFLDTTLSSGKGYRYSVKWQIADREFGRSNTEVFHIPSRNLFKLCIPGMYQLQTGRNIKGSAYLGASVLSLLVAGGLSGAFVYYKSHTEMSEKTYRQCFSSQTGKSVGEAYRSWQKNYELEKAYRTGAIIAAGVFGFSFVVHWIDFAIFPILKRCDDRSDAFEKSDGKGKRPFHPCLVCGSRSAAITSDF